METIQTITQIMTNGLTTGSFYILMALGFTLIFGILRLVNFAHGEFYMLGAFGVYWLDTQFGLPFFLSLVLSTIGVSFIGAIVERVVFAPIRTREMSMMMSALGLQITIQGVMAVYQGTESLSLAPPIEGVFRSNWITFPYERMVVVAASIIVLAGFYGFIRFTRLGQALRAVAQDPEAAAMQGIPVERVRIVAFAAGCGLAAIAGGLIGPVFSLNVYMGQGALLKAFVVVIIGGLGNVGGAVLGGLLLGLAESTFSTLFGGLTSDMLGFLMIMLVLLLKPNGLLGGKHA